MIYDKKQNTSFAIGAFATIELLKQRISDVVGVYFSSKLKINNITEEIFSICKEHKIPLLERTKFIEKVAGKENVFIICEFNKYKSHLNKGNHLVLVNPMDMGNLGTIIRTSLGFNIKNIAIIKPCVDIFDPKVIRASQGAIFSTNICEFESFNDYFKAFKEHQFYMFCLSGNKYLQEINEIKKPYSLVFGNEATGLPENILSYGEKIKIKQSKEIDSFNLAVSVAMALYEFSK